MNWVAPAIKLDGRTVMRNEPFGPPGSTGQGALPDLGDIPGPPEAVLPGDLTISLAASDSVLVTDIPNATSPSATITVTIVHDNKPIDVTDSYFVEVYAGNCNDLPGTPGTIIHTEELTTATDQSFTVDAINSTFSSTDFDTMYEEVSVGESDICLTAQITDPNAVLVEQSSTNNDTFATPEMVNLNKEADLSITKETDPDPSKNLVVPDELVGYIITVTNTNSYGIALNDIEVIDTLDSDMIAPGSVTCNPAICGNCYYQFWTDRGSHPYP